MPCARSRSGSTTTCSCGSFSPQIATLATPGIAISRGRIVHRASTVMSICDCGVGPQPIFRQRLSDDSGGRICGGSRVRRAASAQRSPAAPAPVAAPSADRSRGRRSAESTTSPAPTSSAPSSRNGMPLSEFSIGTVTRPSPPRWRSRAPRSESPRPAARIPGNTSSGTSSAVRMPTTIERNGQRDDDQSQPHCCFDQPTHTSRCAASRLVAISGAGGRARYFPMPNSVPNSSPRRRRQPAFLPAGLLPEQRGRPRYGAWRLGDARSIARRRPRTPTFRRRCRRESPFDGTTRLCSSPRSVSSIAHAAVRAAAVCRRLSVSKYRSAVALGGSADGGALDRPSPPAARTTTGRPDRRFAPLPSFYIRQVIRRTPVRTDPHRRRVGHFEQRGSGVDRLSATHRQIANDARLRRGN